MTNGIEEPIVVQEEVVVRDSAQPQERMLSQSEVNEIVKRRHAEAYEKGKREAMQSQSGLGSMTASPEQIEALIARKTQEELAKLKQNHEEQMMNQHAQRVVSEFKAKMAAGPEKYPDFNQVMEETNLAAYPELVSLTKDLSNTDDVWYEIAANSPQKLVSLDLLAKKSPGRALKELQKLAQSIETNNKAKEQELAKEPLSQVKPSVGVDSGRNSFKGASWLKG